jgi:hypothetical protein
MSPVTWKRVVTAFRFRTGKQIARRKFRVPRITNPSVIPLIRLLYDTLVNNRLKNRMCEMKKENAIKVPLMLSLLELAKDKRNRERVTAIHLTSFENNSSFILNANSGRKQQNIKKVLNMYIWLPSDPERILNSGLPKGMFTCNGTTTKKKLISKNAGCSFFLRKSILHK